MTQRIKHRFLIGLHFAAFQKGSCVLSNSENGTKIWLKLEFLLTETIFDYISPVHFNFLIRKKKIGFAKFNEITVSTI